MNDIKLTHDAYSAVRYQEPGGIRRVKLEVAKHLEKSGHGWEASIRTPSGETWCRRWDAKRWTRTE